MDHIYYEKKESDLINYDLKRKEANMGQSKKIKYDNSGIFGDSNELVIEIVKPKSDLSTWNKICFAAAGLPFQMYFCAISTFVNVFLLDRAKLTPDKVLYILLISRFVRNCFFL